MNTKVKSAPSGGASRSLGRQVGGIPISSRSTVAQTQLKSIPLPPKLPKPKSNERPLKKSHSNGSLFTSKNLDSFKSDKSNSAKQLGRNLPLGAALTVGGHVDINSEHPMVQPPSAESLKSTRSFNSGQKAIDISEILKICQESDTSKVFEIDLHGQNLTSFPDFQQFPKLKILDLSGNHLNSISGLQATKELKELKLYDNDITEIDGLNKLRDLCTLLLQHNKISKIGQGLVSLRNLQMLRLDNNRITVIEPRELVSCANITSLDLSGNKLESLSAVSNLPNLQELFASGNCFKKSSDITKCKKLQEVDLSRNFLTDLSGLANLPNLQILDVSSNQLTTLRSLKKLISLEELNINSNRVAEMGYFVDMFPKLQLLYFMDNKIDKWEEIFFLSKLPDLFEMYMTNNPVNIEDQEILTYHKKIWKAFPILEVLDGVHRRLPGSKQDSGAPVMRPLSASSIISVRQVDSQMKSAYQEEEMLHKSIQEKLTSLQHLVHNLKHSEGFQDTECVDSSRGLDGLPPLAERPDSQISIPSTEPDRVKAKELTTGSLRSSPESEETSASSRCSSRFRIKQARAFAAKNFDDDASDEDDDLSKASINFKFVSS
ncbi:unnamed protein product [Lymnaea stagnalis]|uniref:Disease resistance R13L4/SHOC-2-like LRR domain-containing protein n=1 Tax=Lymnaea stagnalis TaxID=6523 RepID=A0AAV2HGR3_LYMST